MDEQRIQELTKLANSTDQNGEYDISDTTLNRLATTPEGEEAVRRARQQRKS